MILFENAIVHLIDAGRRLYAQGVLPGGGGNLSARTEKGILITASGRCKGVLTADDFVLVDTDGGVIDGENPSSELPMHLSIFRRIGEADAVVHCHSPFTVALTVAGEAFRDDILPEVRLKFGRIPTTEFAMPSTPKSATVLEPFLRENLKGAILPRHGIVAIGRNIEEAVMVAEQIEYAAKVQFLASQIAQRLRGIDG